MSSLLSFLSPGFLPPHNDQVPRAASRVPVAGPAVTAAATTGTALPLPAVSCRTHLPSRHMASTSPRRACLAERQSYLLKGAQQAGGRPGRSDSGPCHSPASTIRKLSSCVTGGLGFPPPPPGMVARLWLHESTGEAGGGHSPGARASWVWLAHTVFPRRPQETPFHVLSVRTRVNISPRV